MRRCKSLLFGLVLSVGLNIAMPTQAQTERYYKEGLQLLQEGAWPMASQRFRQALLQTEDRAEIWFALGVSLYQQQDLTGAYQAYTSGLRLLPSLAIQARLRSGLGDIFFEQQNFPQAIEAYTQALAFQPNWSGVRLKLATALLREQRFQEALIQSEWLQQQSLPPAESLYLQSLIYLAQKDLESAIPSLEKLAQYPEHAFNARQMLTWLYQNNHEKDYQRNAAALAAMASDYPAVYRVLGFSESQRFFQCFLEQSHPCHNPTYLETLQRWRLSGINTDSAYFALGNYYQLHHDWERAASAFLRAAQIFPERHHYQQKAYLMARSQNTARRFPLTSNFPPKEEQDNALWRELSVWNEHFVKTAQTPPEPSLSPGQTLFWQGFGESLWYQPPTGETKKRWAQAEKLLEEGAEKKIIQSWRLQQAGETSWALKTLEEAQYYAPDWWLPYALWSIFAQESGGYSLESLQRHVEIAYSLNPISLRIAELRFNPQLGLEEKQVKLREVLTTFPEHSAFQDMYLKTLQNSLNADALQK